MTLTKYILTSTKHAGKLILTYQDGRIYSLINEFKTMNEHQFERLVAELPFEEVNIQHLETIGLVLKQDLKTNEKIALFCKVYEQHRNRKFKVSAAESGKIGAISFNDELLQYYFTSENFLWKNKYSIHNLVKYYNELCDEFNHKDEPKQVKRKFPNTYSSSFVKMLDGPGLTAYYEHLRSLGLKAVKHTDGTVLDFIK